MTDLAALLDVQEHDTRTDQLRHRLATLAERQLLDAERTALADAAAAGQSVEEQRRRVGRDLQRLEDDVSGIDAKAAQVDRTLYSSTVTNPRELQALQDELGALARRKSQLEDGELDLMEQAEPLDAELARLAATKERHEAEIARLADALTTTEAELSAELARVEGERAELVEPIPAELLAEYDRLRGQLGGVAVARLTGTTCGGCHLGLSAVEVDRIRREPPEALVHCEECGRLLVRS